MRRFSENSGIVSSLNEAPSEGAQDGPTHQQCWGGGVHDGQLPTFDAESKSAKIPKSLSGGGGGGWGGGGG